MNTQVFKFLCIYILRTILCVLYTLCTIYNIYISGPGSSVGIATDYGLDGPGLESRLGARFSAPVQTGPGAHPASGTVGAGSLPGVESGRGVTADPSPLSSAEV
jgi:hypothetical protein